MLIEGQFEKDDEDEGYGSWKIFTTFPSRLRTMNGEARLR